MKKILFIDRDGSILKQNLNKMLDSFDKIEFLPFIFSNLHHIIQHREFELVMMIEQNVSGEPAFSDDKLLFLHNRILQFFKNEGIQFLDVLTYPNIQEKFVNSNYDLAKSFIISNKLANIRLAKTYEIKSIFINKTQNKDASFTLQGWDTIYKLLYTSERKATIRRKTKETDIDISLNLDGEGSSKITGGFGFLNHMLDLFAKHTKMDLFVKIKGDLHVDEHHTIEDIAIVLGKALRKALGDKKGIERYGFLLPMDESRAEVAIDFSGRSNLVWKVKFKREKIGEIPTEMFYHFFKSFAENAKCTLYVKAKGNNEHHKIEAVFKAFAKALKMAVQRDILNKQVPSTKGVL